MIVVVVVQSAAFTGSTWLCYVSRESREGVLSGKPGYRLGSLSGAPRREPAASTTRSASSGRKSTAATPTLRVSWRRLVDVSGCSTLVLYNPRHEPFLSQIADGSLAREVVRTRVIRDVRQRYASWKRRNKDKTVIDAVGGFLTSAKFQKPSDVDESGIVDLRHELLSTDRNYVVEQAASLDRSRHEGRRRVLLEIQSPSGGGERGDAHHLPTLSEPGEAGAGAGWGLPSLSRRRVEKGTDFRFDDDRWESEVSEYERFVIDVVAGEMNQANGYERDAFSDEQRRAEWGSRLSARGKPRRATMAGGTQFGIS